MSERPVVCIVDDNAMVRSSVEMTVKTFVPAVHVETYASGQAFLDAVDERCQCLLLDIRMDGMSGFDVIREMSDRNRRIPTILMSGHTDELTSSRELPSFVKAFVEKPFRSREIVEQIQRLLNVTRDHEICE